MAKSNRILNLLFISLFCSSQLFSQAVNSQESNLVFAHLLPWFSDLDKEMGDKRPLRTHWIAPTDNSYDLSIKRYCGTPLSGEYDSADPALIEYQVLLAYAAGIDGFIINWYGEGSYEDYATARIFQRVSEMNAKYNELNFKLCISYDEQAMVTESSKNRVRLPYVDSDSSMRADFRYIKSKYMDYQAGVNPYFVYENKPVLSIYPAATAIFKETDAQKARRVLENWNRANRTEPLFVWKNAADSVFNCIDVVYPWPQPSNPANINSSGCWLDSTDWGGKVYFIPGDPDPKSYIKDFFYRVTHLNDFGGGNLEFIMGSVWPGFNDRYSYFPRSIGENCRYMARNISDGNVYSLCWNAMLHPPFGAKCQWMQIVSWNDWNEGTQIEPDRDYRYFYVKTTEDSILSFKNILNNDKDRDCEDLHVSLCIYNARKTNRATDADSAVDLFFSKKFEPALLKANGAVWYDDFHDISNWKPVTGGFACDISSDSCHLTQKKIGNLKACKMLTKFDFQYSSSIDTLTIKIVKFLSPQTTVVVKVQSLSMFYPEYTIFSASCDSGPGIYSGSISAVWRSVNEDSKFWITIWLESGDSLGAIFDYITLGPVTVRDTCISTVENSKYEEIQKGIPDEFKLHQNYPNPFNSSTTLKFSLPKASYVEIAILDILGREVIKLVSERRERGLYKIEWDGRDRYGNHVASGIYLVSMKTESFHSYSKIALVK